MNEFLEHDLLTPFVYRVFYMQNAPAAFEYLASGKHFRKVVIRL